MLEEKKNWLLKHAIGSGIYVIMFFLLIIAGIYYWQYSSSKLISQIQQESGLACVENVPIRAVNKYTGEEKEFPNSCNFPRGWTKLTASSQNQTSESGVYTNDDYGFTLKVTPDFKNISYGYNGKVDYVGVYLSSDTNDGVFINPKGGQDLLVPDSAAKESSFAMLAGKNVRIKKWDLPGGRSLVRYVFKDQVNNWNSCADVDKPSINCNRIDVLAGNSSIQSKLVSVVSNISFFTPISEKTTDLVYYYAANKFHTYNPNTGTETTNNLPGLTNYAIIKKLSGNQVVYLNNDQVETQNLSSGQPSVLFAKNTENGLTYVPDSFAVAADESKIAIGYRYGTEENVNGCGATCKNVKVGILIIDLSTLLTKGSFDIPILASPVVWSGSDIVLHRWDNSGYSSVSQSGAVTASYSVPAGLIKPVSTISDTKLIRTDKTAAVQIRNQQDRFGKASYLFVNGKVVYKGTLASINLVQN